MKQIFTQFNKTVLAAFVMAAATSILPAAAQVVVEESMSATTADGVTLENPIFTNDNSKWTIASGGTSELLGTTGDSNYGPCLPAPLEGDWIAYMANVEEAGRYTFGFRAKVDNGLLALGAMLSYGSTGTEMIDAMNSFAPINNYPADEIGDFFESQVVDLEAGNHFFYFRVGKQYASATNLHVADFTLTYVEPLRENCTVHYTVEGNEADVRLTNWMTGEELENGAEMEQMSMYELVVTPANPADHVSITLNGTNVDSQVYDDGGYYTYYGYVLTESHELVIRVGSGVEDGVQGDAAVTYDNTSCTLTGYCGRTEVFDMTGKLVRTFELQGTVSLGDLEPGVYVVRTAQSTLKIAR